MSGLPVAVFPRSMALARRRPSGLPRPRPTGPHAEELVDVAAVTFPDLGFGALDAYWARLTTLADACDEPVADRQQALARQRREPRLPTDAPDVRRPRLAVSYPVLSVGARLAGRADGTRRAVERAMAHCP